MARALFGTVVVVMILVSLVVRSDGQNKVYADSPRPPYAFGCEAGATNVTTASAITNEVSAGHNVCVIAAVGTVVLDNISSPSEVIVSTTAGGSMGDIEIHGSTHITIRKARFRSTDIRDASFITIEKSKLGGNSDSDRVLDQLIFMPATTNDVTIQDNELGWTTANNIGDNEGNTGYGCRCYGTNNRLHFQRNWLHDLAGDGFQGVGGTDVLIDRNEIGPVGASPESSDHSDNIQITGNGPNLRITNNWIHHQGYYSGQESGNSGATYIHGTDEDNGDPGVNNSLLYENNLVEHSLGRVEIGGLGTGGVRRSNITIRGNTFRDLGTEFSNFAGLEWDVDTGTNNLIERNIAIDPDGGLAMNGSTSAVTLQNNIFGLANAVTLDADGNCMSSSCNPVAQPAIGYHCPTGVWWCSTSLVGDINLDGAVDGLDLTILLGDYAKTTGNATDSGSDVDENGTINIFDLSKVLKYFGS